MIRVECGSVSSFWGPGKSKKDEVVITTEKQLEILKNVRRGSLTFIRYDVSVYEDDVLIESFYCDYHLTSYLREEKEIDDFIERRFKERELHSKQRVDDNRPE